MAIENMNDEVQRTLGRLEGKLDMMLEGMKLTSDRVTSIDTRVDSLEKDQHTSKVILGILAGVAGALASNFPTIFGWLTSKT